ncbi:unnamed protein product [Danaus chrysippus]|uniref:(African queen) hypothetical protein n=1 Tax=Danaus chrysippus TaxID=151541 RepID=A0A8J2QW68_9NEOP|nr:unnamed protein product [Danaus chrysippus]
MLALLLLVHNAAGKDTQKDVPTIQPIVSCPDVGYYFKRDVNPNSISPGPCNLCFCQDNATAVCWPRDSSRCDPKHYSYYGKRKRENREKRSPAFTDIFFRDAAREVFHRQTPEQCKPYESSFSEGCPPADWCIGCTVCDCDANGRWDCHTLSFCPDKKGKQVVKKKRNSQRSRRQLAKGKHTVKTTKKPAKTLTKKPSKTIKKSNKNVVKQNKVKINTKQQVKNSKNNHHKNNANKKGSAKRASPVKKTKKPFQNKKVPPKKKIPNKKIQQSKKSMSTKTKPVPVNKRNTFDPSETVKYTKMILNRVMDSVNKVVNETQKSFQKDKSLKKSPSSKHTNNVYDKNKHNNGKKISKWHQVKNMPPSRKEKRSRRKRQVITENKIQKVSDGIDILIEAIKSAPDIKSFNKIVFDNKIVQTNQNIISTTETRLAVHHSSPFYNVNKNIEKVHFHQVNDSVKEFDSIDADEGYGDIYDYNKTYPQKELKVNRFFDIEVTEKIIDTTMGPKVYVADNDDEKINIILDRYESDKSDDKRGFEVFTDDTDEEGPIISSSRTPEVETELDIEAVTQRTPKRTTIPPQVIEINEKHSIHDSKSDKQANLDWTELENSSREEERKDIVERKVSTTQTPIQLVTRTLKKPAHKYADPTSSASREEEEAQAKTVNPEYVMHKKQLNLLNSLDYETEKSVIDAESKEDKYNSETFSFM